MTSPNTQAYSHEDYLNLQKKFQEREKQIEAQLWIDRNISEFDDLLRLNYNKSIQEFTTNVITSLAEMSNAFSGVFYTLDQATQLLEAVAGYACKINTLAKKEYQVGEGIIGQAALSKKMLFFNNLPPENTEVKLSSITINAANIMIIPLIFNEKVYGVIELVHIIALESKYVELFTKLNRNIAVMIESISNNALTKKLLTDSQTQTEKLLAQEEELRQNLEELSTTQENLARKEIQTQAQIHAIDLTLATIEFDIEGYILHANNMFLDVMGYTLHEIKGKHHKIFIDETYAESKEYASFWDKLRQGNTHSDEFFRKHKKGYDVWLRATYTPVLDTNGSPIKVLKLALDITKQKQQVLDFEGQLFAISQSNALVEFNLEGEIIKANDIFLDLFQYQKSEVIHQHHRIFVTPEEKDSEAYHQFWANLKAGQFQKGEFERLNKNGESIWIRGSYNPILTPKGEPYKVIKVAQDITQQKKLELRLLKNT